MIFIFIFNYFFFRSNPTFSDTWEVLFDDISLDKIIGEGAFGKVYSGKLLKQPMEVVKGKKSSQHKAKKEQQQMKIGLAVAVKMLQSMICWQQQNNIYTPFRVAQNSFQYIPRLIF